MNHAWQAEGSYYLPYLRLHLEYGDQCWTPVQGEVGKLERPGPGSRSTGLEGEAEQAGLALHLGIFQA